jgi:nucleoside-diphosphate-sugar epimerase
MSKKVAILGASGHIGKNLILYLSKKKNIDLFLFSKNKKNVNNFLKQITLNGNKIKVDSYNHFEENQYNVVINCTGNNKDLEKNNKIFFKKNRFYDNKIIKYLKKNKSCLYIYLSSGAIYGSNFLDSVNEDSKIIQSKNKINDEYVMAKIDSERKHRKLSELNIVDLRIFSFFSRFLEEKTNFFLTDVLNALKYQKKLLTNNINIQRDYIHPYDLSEIILKLIKKQMINDVYDISSKKPTTKFEIIKFLKNNYNLKYKIDDEEKENTKINYFSTSKKFLKFGYCPKYTSIETIKMEISQVLKEKNQKKL